MTKIPDNGIYTGPYLANFIYGSVSVFVRIFKQ